MHARANAVGFAFLVLVSDKITAACLQRGLVEACDRAPLTVISRTWEKPAICSLLGSERILSS